MEHEQLQCMRVSVRREMKKTEQKKKKITNKHTNSAHFHESFHARLDMKFAL